MDQMLLDAEGAARLALDSVGGDPCPYRMLSAWELGWTTWLGPSIRRGSLVFLDARKSATRQRWDAAHEFGHFIAGHVGLDPRDERTANAIASAVLMPDADYKRSASTCGWDLDALTSEYGVSYEAAARRLCQVRGAVASVFDDDRLTRRWRSPWLVGGGFSRRSVPSWELAVAQECVDAGEGVRGQPSVYWLPSSWGERVVVVTDVESWERLSRSDAHAAELDHDNIVLGLHGQGRHPA